MVKDFSAFLQSKMRWIASSHEVCHVKTNNENGVVVSFIQRQQYFSRGFIDDETIERSLHQSSGRFCGYSHFLQVFNARSAQRIVPV